jgi:hypothetical protein
MDENQIVAAVCAHLTSSGYSVELLLHTTEYGVNIVARHPATDRCVLVEAKGGTSSRDGGARYGKP